MRQHCRSPRSDRNMVIGRRYSVNETIIVIEVGELFGERLGQGRDDIESGGRYFENRLIGGVG